MCTTLKNKPSIDGFRFWHATSNNNLMVSSILVYQYGVPAVLAPASIIPVLFWLAPAGSSDDRGQRGHRVEVTVDSG